MSRRDECLISNYEEATEWLAEFKHTIIDEQALKVIECLSENIEELRETIEDLKEELESK
jgi:DNA-directed RNA polymerase subunit L